jgi:hypothetical protein
MQKNITGDWKIYLTKGMIKIVKEFQTKIFYRIVLFEFKFDAQ